VIELCNMNDLFTFVFISQNSSVTLAGSLFKISGLEIIFPEINNSVEYNNLAVKVVPKITEEEK